MTRRARTRRADGRRRAGPPGRGILLLVGLLLSCAGTRPADLGVREGRLAPCPPRPNCVCSDARDASHRVEALQLHPDARDVWEGVREAVARMPRTRIVAEADGYLHAECESRLLGFVDDLELHLRPDQGVVAVRSASRLGYSDMGVNRARVESLRSELRVQGVVR